MLFRSHGEAIAPIVAKSFLPKAKRAAGPTFGFMFGTLSDDPANRVPDGAQTIAALHALGAAMASDPSNEESHIPAAYTYFGQFIDHDITLMEFDPSIQAGVGSDIIEAVDFLPLPRSDVEGLVTNLRSAPLDLDSVYEGFAAKEATEPDGKMRLGKVSPVDDAIPTADKDHDLPRRILIRDPQSLAEKEADRQALIGDPRNDENLIVAQLHVAFLRSHNALMARGLDAASAITAIRRRYQWAVLHDFLPRVCNRAVVDDVLTNGASVWPVDDPSKLFIPVEFAGAAYRFGHSMIRAGYSHNAIFNPASFRFFFTFTALSGDLQPGPGHNTDFPTLPDNWIIEWPRFFSPPGKPDEPGINPARRIDTRLTPELGRLRDFQGNIVTTLMGKLASRNLLRGYLLGLPTGQAVAKHIGAVPLSEAALIAALPAELPQATLDSIKAAGLLERTPLWFYVLAEAGDANGGNGQKLGVVGSRIVVETLWNLARHARDSVVTSPPDAAELASGEYTLKGIVKIGQDSGMDPIS